MSLILSSSIVANHIENLERRVELINAADRVFRDGMSGKVDGFKAVDLIDEDGFKVIVYDRRRFPGFNHRKKMRRMIAIRGTANSQNERFDRGPLLKSSFNNRKVPEDRLEICNQAANSYIDRNKRQWWAAGIEKVSNFIHRHIQRDGIPKDSIFITGHSLGGFLAQYFAVEYQLNGIGFDPPPLGSFVGINYDFVLKRHQYRTNSDLSFDCIAYHGDLVSWHLYGEFLKSPLIRVSDGYDHPWDPLLGQHHSGIIANILQHDLDYAKKNKNNRSHRFLNQNIAFKAHNNTFISSKKIAMDALFNPSGVVRSAVRGYGSSDDIGKTASCARAWEYFKVIKVEHSDSVYLRDFHGRYLCVNPSGTVNTAPHASGWEEFKILQTGRGRFELFNVAHGLHIQVTNNCNVRAVKNDSWWESFEIHH